jgi:hypothetical protein
MSFGNPIAIREGTHARQFQPLSRISVRREDPNFFKEDLLQELINASPEVLPVREYLSTANSLYSLGREVPVDLGANKGYIDNLLVTDDGQLVIVETKLYRNPEGIREVIAQTLQYGMAVTQMPLLELEARIKQGQAPALRQDETISACVSRIADEHPLVSPPTDNFDEALERYLRRGEVLLLIVSDAIHVGVERVTHWLNEQGSSTPFKFGLIELKFFSNGPDRLVVPRTVLKTREVSRHVVVVDIRPGAGPTLSAEVTDEFRTQSGGKTQETRSVKPSSPPLTKNSLLENVPAEERDTATRLLHELEAYPFDTRGYPSTLQFGFTYPSETGEFHPLINLMRGGVWASLNQSLRKTLGDERVRAYKVAANEFGLFYRDDQLNRMDSTGCQVRFSQIVEKAADFAAFLDSYRTEAIRLLDQKTDT